MLQSEAIMIAVAGGIAGLIVFAVRRPMTLVAFDPDYAATRGVNVARTDAAILFLSLLVTVIGLKIVGLVLVVALLIIPPVAARFWTERVERLILIAAAIGGVSGFVGTAMSAAFAGVPTGPVIVLVAFSIFAVSLLASPQRGVLAAALARRDFQRRVHARQGLLALARGEQIFDGLTLSVLRRRGYIRRDGVATLDGRAAAAKALRDEARWEMAARTGLHQPAMERYDGVTPIEAVLTRDQIADLDSRLGPVHAVE